MNYFYNQKNSNRAKKEKNWERHRIMATIY